MRNGLLLVFTLVLCAAGADFDWNLPQGFPRPTIPADNPMSAAKVSLGRYLFYDRRLSVNRNASCASCHRQELAFTDGLARAKGATGELHPRGSMSLVNVAYAPFLTWAGTLPPSLEEQMLVPMLGEQPVELGLKDRLPELLSAVRADDVYRELFPRAFPGESDVVTIGNIAKAIAAFERSIVSMRSPYDRYRWGGEPDAISAEAKRGEILFSSSEQGGCFQCHGGWNFSGAVRFEGGKDVGAGKFRAPSLRNIAVTAPYMHDGSIAELGGVIDHYAGGKGTNARSFRLNGSDRKDLVEFLKSLTDDALLRDERWSDPWPKSK